jgi:hypothetical protein
LREGDPWDMVRTVNRAPALLASVAGIALAVACADLKSAEPAGGSGASSSGTTSSGGSSGTGTTSSSGGGSSSGSTTLGPGSKGPGPFGALPFGYCCTSDDECRGRNCAQVGTQKLCLDACRSPETCTGTGLPAGFTCDAPSQYDDGSCQPPSGFTCLAANTFVTGTKTAGACCSPTGDGLSGVECAGGHCDWYKASSDPQYEPPWFCTNRCDVPADCGNGMKCHFEIGKCVPANEPFVCD